MPKAGSSVSFSALIAASALSIAGCASSAQKPEVAQVEGFKPRYVETTRTSRTAGAREATTAPAGDLKAYGKASQDYKKSVGVFTNPQIDPAGLDPIAAAAFWGSRYEKTPADAEAAVQYSMALRKIGSVDESVSVMTKAIIAHPDDANVNLETGRALIEGERAFEAVRYIEIALETKKGDWRALSAYGVALDQIGEHAEARQKYDAALLAAPGAVSVMSNKGLSFAMSGDLTSAATVLRAAATNRRADARVRQNLALVLALKGELREAERLARSDLPPQIADRNVQYYRQLVNQPAYWQALAGDDVDTPTFESAPPKPARAEPPQTKSAPAPQLEQPKAAPKAKDPDAPIALQGGPVSPAKTSLAAPSNAPGAAPATLQGGAVRPAKTSLEVPAPDLKKQSADN